MKRLQFLQAAEEEFLEAVAWYENIESGLGQRFRRAVEAATGLATALPQAGAPWRHGTRRVLPKNFPYSIIYREEKDVVVVYAVAHFRRRPDYWRKRAGK